LAVSQELEEEHELVTQQNHIYLGGRGGDFRGTLEAVHFSRGSLPSGYQQYAPVKSDNTLGLWRFEEPVTPISLITTTPSITASTSANSTITIGTTAAQALVDELSGQSGLTSLDFTASPYSGGNYSVTVHAASSTSTASIPKVPYNILVNPLGYNQTTGKPTGKSPERMRLMSVDASAGTITVESIHLDFSANPTSGRRGALMNHDAGRFVIITGDCIVDTGNGNDFQPYGTGTQFSQRQGQVIIDESDFNNNGIMFSQSMAIDSHEYNQFSASTTNVGKQFVAGHSGRHVLNHVVSHPFMGTLPPTSSHDVEKKLDIGSDVLVAGFPSQFSDIRSTIPINSVVSSYDTHGPIKIESLSNSTLVNSVVENGMSDIDDTQRGILAIGGKGFDPEPFMLKSTSANDEKGDTKHIIPASESRIAILHVPDLSTYNYAPFLQVHYNAIDVDGNQFTTGATSRLTTNISGGNTVLTLQSIKSFGFDGETISANLINIAGTVASSSSSIVGTIDYATKTGAIVKVSNFDSKIMITNILPKVDTIVTGSTSILDVIRSSLKGRDLRLFSPGGVIEFNKPEMFGFLDGDLEGETSEGTVAEKVLNYDLCPENYLPLTSTDSFPQSCCKN
jgi:hypothetical protein